MNAVPFQASDHARRLMSEAIVWDNTIPWTGGIGDEALKDALPGQMRAAGVTVASLTVAGDDPALQTLEYLAPLYRYWRERADTALLARTGDDVRRAKAEGKLAVVFHFQGSLPVERNLDLVDLYYELGVRHMLMAYNQRNFVANGCHEPNDSGLSAFGRSFVRRLNEVGMWVDVAHTAPRSVADAIEVSTQPVICSHGNIAAIHKHPRCYTDGQIKAIAATGGVFGLTGLGLFMGGNDASVPAFVRQIDHAVQLVGPRHVGLGLDYVYDMPALERFAAANAAIWPEDGGYTTPDLQQLAHAKLIEIVDQLIGRGYGDDDIKDILGGNWLRLADQVWR